jgi:hypothetical protein
VQLQMMRDRCVHDAGLGSDSKAGQPFGEWLDMHGDRWVKSPEGKWSRIHGT